MQNFTPIGATVAEISATGHRKELKPIYPSTYYLDWKAARITYAHIWIYLRLICWFLCAADQYTERMTAMSSVSVCPSITRWWCVKTNER